MWLFCAVESKQNEVTDDGIATQQKNFEKFGRGTLKCQGATAWNSGSTLLCHIIGQPLCDDVQSFRLNVSLQSRVTP
jgi:hypothetical protein